MANPTPVVGTATFIATGGTPVQAIPPMPNGGIITNPALAADQGISTPEVLFVNAVGDAGLVGNGANFALQPGQSWTVIPGQTTPTSVNAVTSGHSFSVTYW